MTAIPPFLSAATTAMRVLNVFIADDFPLVREGLRSLIDAQPDMHVVGEAEDGEDAWQQIRTLCRAKDTPSDAIDVVVMDDAMPNIDGAEATTAIRQAYPHIKVLAYSMHEDQKTLRALLVAGATGYVLKTSPTTELLRAIRLLRAGDCYIDPALTGKVVDSLITHQTPTLDDEAVGITLSEREEETLRLIALGYTNVEIAAQIHLSVKSIEVFKARGMKKLRLGSRVALMCYAIQDGWLETN